MRLLHYIASLRIKVLGDMSMLHSYNIQSVSSASGCSIYGGAIVPYAYLVPGVPMTRCCAASALLRRRCT